MRRPIEPGPDQESVWDYPRPPRVEAVGAEVRVELAGVVLARSSEALRVLETSHPPTIYVPRASVDWSRVVPSSRRPTHCEYKGRAVYWSVRSTDLEIDPAGWSYPDPTHAYRQLAGRVAFFAGDLECYIGADRARAQAGSFYGGWITDRIVGPFKGGSGTRGW